jgi:hypothetical protein
MSRSLPRYAGTPGEGSQGAPSNTTIARAPSPASALMKPREFCENAASLHPWPHSRAPSRRGRDGRRCVPDYGRIVMRCMAMGQCMGMGGWSAGRRFGVKRFNSPGHEPGFYPAFFTIGRIRAATDGAVARLRHVASPVASYWSESASGRGSGNAVEPRGITSDQRHLGGLLEHPTFQRAA